MDNEELQIGIDKFYENYKGAFDPRTPEEKASDYDQREFVAEATPVLWIEKKPNEWREFPEQNQFFTYKCVAFTIAKLALINFWLKTGVFLFFSPNSIYDYRINKPSGGMVGDNSFKIWQDNGIALEAVCKSTQIQESDPIEISSFAKEVAKGFKLDKHITIPEKDFDRVASTTQVTKKGVMVWFYFTSREFSRTYPVVMDNLTGPDDPRASRHSVCEVDFGLIDGKEYLKIDDSAKFGGLGKRWISREFFEARNFLSKYPMNFNYEDPVIVPPTLPVPPTPPSFVFTIPMKFGDTNIQVNELQKYLQKLGYFPNNIGTTSYFGNVTKGSVIKFQTARGLLADGVVGVLTLKALNSA